MEALVSLVGELRSSGADLKLAREDQFHLTLKFLGDVPDAEVPRYCDELKRLALPASFALLLQDVGAFPDWKKLNVLWVGVQDPTGAFGRAFVQVEGAFTRLGFDSEGRAFRPHLTIARKRTDRGRERAQQVLERWRGRRFGEATVRQIRFYKSTLTPNGPVYEAIEEVPLP